MEVHLENCGIIVSLSDFAIAARTHARVLYSSLVLMVVNLELVRLKKMSRTLEILVEIMSPTYFCTFSQKTSKRFSSSDSSLIGCSRKGVYGV